MMLQETSSNRGRNGYLGGSKRHTDCFKLNVKRIYQSYFINRIRINAFCVKNMICSIINDISTFISHTYLSVSIYVFPVVCPYYVDRVPSKIAFT